MLGKLPIGYFEVLEKDGPGKITAGSRGEERTDGGYADCA